MNKLGLANYFPDDFLDITENSLILHPHLKNKKNEKRYSSERLQVCGI